jgi:hypothetical protein
MMGREREEENGRCLMERETKVKRRKCALVAPEAHARCIRIVEPLGLQMDSTKGLH